MFIAMNRFKIIFGKESVFEDIWRTRESNLKDVDGFRTFHLLRGTTKEDSYTLFATHVVWNDQAAFEAWTQSEQFRRSHSKAGAHKEIYLGHPTFEGFEVILQEPS